MCDIVVKRLMFAISSPDEFLSTFAITFHIFVVGSYAYGLIVAGASPGQQTIPERDVVRSRVPLTLWWAPTISLEQLKLELSNFAIFAYR